MLRVVLIQVGLFLVPFLLFALWLWISRRSLRAMNIRMIFFMAMAGAVLSIGFLILFGESASAPPGARYVPPHMENGTYVPGQFLPPESP